MLRKLFWGLLLLTLTGCAGCDETPGNTFIEDSKPENAPVDSIRLTILREGDGARVTPNSVVVFHAKGHWLPKKKPVMNTELQGGPLVVHLGHNMVVEGLEQALLRLREGASFEVEVPAALGYGDTVYKRIPPRSPLFYRGTVLEVRTPVPALDTTGITPEATSSGLRVYRITPGNGNRPGKGQEVAVHYNGYLSNGLKFDSSYDKRNPLRFRMGEDQVIAGVEDAVATMTVGEKVRIIVPPDLGYGAYAVQQIPANSTLVYDLELIRISD